MDKIKTLDNSLKGKYLYFSEETKQDKKYYILICDYIEENIIYSKKLYYLYVPKNISIKCFVYSNISEIEIKNQEFFEISKEEFINTFRVFVTNEGNYPDKLPSKIIQDI